MKGILLARRTSTPLNYYSLTLQTYWQMNKKADNPESVTTLFNRPFQNKKMHTCYSKINLSNLNHSVTMRRRLDWGEKQGAGPFTSFEVLKRNSTI